MALRVTSIKRVVAVLLVPLLEFWSALPPALAQAPPAPASAQSWPREFQSGDSTITVYQPQLDSWKLREPLGAGRGLGEGRSLAGGAIRRRLVHGEDQCQPG